MVIDWQSKIVRTVMLPAGYRTSAYYINACEQQGIRVGKTVRALFDNITLPVITEAAPTSIVRVSNADLDCVSCYTLQTTLVMGRSIANLEYCSLEEVLQFRLEYMDQPMNEQLIAITDPVEKAGNKSDILSIEHDKHGLWLYSHSYDLTTVRNSLSQFLWKLPASSP